jgi:hypothetical protein
MEIGIVSQVILVLVTLLKKYRLSPNGLHQSMASGSSQAQSLQGREYSRICKHIWTYHSYGRVSGREVEIR